MIFEWVFLFKMSFYGFLLLTWLKWSLLCNVDCCWSFWVKCLISSSTKSLRISNRISARKCLNSSFLNFPEHPIHRRIFRLLPRPGSSTPMSELPIISRTSRILFPSELPTHRRNFRHPKLDYKNLGGNGSLIFSSSHSNHRRPLSQHSTQPAIFGDTEAPSLLFDSKAHKTRSSSDLPTLSSENPLRYS